MRRLRNMLKNTRNWLGYLLMKAFRKKAPDFTFFTRRGLKITVPRRLLQTYKECFFDETYHKGLSPEKAKLQVNSVVDIGANAGYFSLFAAEIYPNAKIISYEPVPANFKQLSTYKAQNPGINWEIVNEAVSGGESSIRLSLDSGDSFTTDASIFNLGGHSDSIEVKCISLDTLMKKHGLKAIGFLKLDCEGSEYDILWNASAETLNSIPLMAVETHPGPQPGQDLESLRNFLNEKGFNTSVRGSKIYAWR